MQTNPAQPIRVAPWRASPTQATMKQSGPVRTAPDPWALLPSDLAMLLRPGIAVLTAEILAEVRRTVADLAPTALAPAVRDGIEQAIFRFLDRLAEPPHDRPSPAALPVPPTVSGLSQVHRASLARAYRIGARVAWRHIAALGQRAGVSAGTMCVLADAVFSYVEEMTVRHVTAPGAGEARSELSVTVARTELLRALLAAGTASVPERLARLAHWPLPKQVVTIALSPPHTGAPRPSPPVNGPVLADLHAADPVMVIPADDLVVLNQLSVSLSGWRAAVGPEVAVTEAAESHRLAKHTLRLVRYGVLADAAVSWYDQHLCCLWLLEESELIRSVTERALAPLKGVPNPLRARLSETLLLALEEPRSATVIARILGVHPQTVRYRLKQLDRLFDGRLADPDTRFDVALALRARRALPGELPAA